MIDPVTGDEMIDILSTLAPNLLRQPCLDHGFVNVLDCMPRLIPVGAVGGDFALADAARISYQKGTRKTKSDAGLIDHLVRNEHCYHPDMQVLTAQGWKRWKDLGTTADFAVPDPTSKRITFETLPVKVFEAREQTLTRFKNSIASFSVTANHRLWFKKKFQGREGPKSRPYEVYSAHDCPVWGWFESGAAYAVHAKDTPKDPLGQLIGFYLGDGCHVSKNTIVFHLCKPRKIEYIRRVAKEMGLDVRDSQSATHAIGRVIRVRVPESFWDLVCPNARATGKAISAKALSTLAANGPLAAGIFDGLNKSDGSRSKEREQYGFSSCSVQLIELYELLNAFFGFDCRRGATQHGVLRTTAYLAAPLEVESRKSYWTTKRYVGRTYCATTSTGFLITRGKDRECAIISGNSSPIEMGELKFHIRLPIFVMRQHVRHRTACISSGMFVSFDLPGGIARGRNQHYTLTVAQLMSRRTKAHKWARVQKMRARSVNEETGAVYHTSIKDIWSNGFKQVQRVTFGDGSILEATADHLCWTDQGWLKLGQAIKRKALFVGIGSAPMRSITKSVVRVEDLGLQEVFDIEVEGPYHNFAANGTIVHNSLNEESARYSELASDFYVPDPKDWAMNTTANKQATVKYEITPETANSLHKWITEHNEESYALYKRLLEGDADGAIPPIAREQARMVLGVNVYTQCVWKIDLKNLLHYLRLRTDPHAQYEIRVFADAIARVVAVLFPATWASFKDNFIDGVRFSGAELKLLHTKTMDPEWSASRKAEFEKKLRRAGFSA